MKSPWKNDFLTIWLPLWYICYYKVKADLYWLKCQTSRIWRNWNRMQKMCTLKEIISKLMSKMKRTTFIILNPTQIPESLNVRENLKSYAFKMTKMNLTVSLWKRLRKNYLKEVYRETLSLMVKRWLSKIAWDVWIWMEILKYWDWITFLKGKTKFTLRWWLEEI